MNFLKQIDSQIYAVLILAVGVYLEVTGHTVGHDLVGGGLTLLRVTSTPAIDHLNIDKANVKV